MRASHSLVALASSLSLLLGAASASAHFNLTSPTPSNKADMLGGKGAPPCGPDTTNGDITAVQGGQEITVSVDETVVHGGFYRVALALKSRTELPPDNVVYDAMNKMLAPTGPGTSDHADYEMTPKFPVLADHLFPHAQSAAKATYTQKIVLPNVTCDKCTLQVIEFMAPHGPNGSAGYFYHHCADLKITADPAKPIFDPNGSGGGGSGAGGAAGAAGAGMGGAGGSSAVGGTGTTGGAGASSAGSGVTSGGTAAGTAGSLSTAGTTTATGGAGGSGTSTGSATSTDSGGCGMSGHRQGSAAALGALGLLFAFARRRAR